MLLLDSCRSVNSFQMAVREGILHVNPTSGALIEIKKSHVWVKTKRKSLTVAEQKAFMNYLFEKPW